MKMLGDREVAILRSDFDESCRRRVAGRARLPAAFPRPVAEEVTADAAAALERAWNERDDADVVDRAPRLVQLDREFVDPRLLGCDEIGARLSVDDDVRAARQLLDNLFAGQRGNVAHFAARAAQRIEKSH